MEGKSVRRATRCVDDRVCPRRKISAAPESSKNVFGRVSRNGTQASASGIPLPPWSTGIIDLAGNCKLILEAQSLRAKIFFSKNLVPCIEEQSSKTGRSALQRTVTASTMIARTRLWTQGQMSQRAVEKAKSSSIELFAKGWSLSEKIVSFHGRSGNIPAYLGRTPFYKTDGHRKRRTTRPSRFYFPHHFSARREVGQGRARAAREERLLSR
jgi:hypothetical protein